ncbi:calcium-binding protein [Paracoccaceae bacterium GXU_MW_L88]
MGLFGYRDLDKETLDDLIKTSHDLAVYSSTSGALGISGTNGILDTVLGALPDGLVMPDSNSVSLSDGWRELTPDELGLPDSVLNSGGNYAIEGPVSGNLPGGAEAKILGQFDEAGNLTKVSLSFAGTNGLADILDFLQLVEGTIWPNFEIYASALANYATANGLTGADAIITGYSLGGGYTNIMHENKHALAGGFFADSYYVGHAAPVIHDDPGIVNIGYENDVVHRLAGDKDTFAEALEAGGLTLTPPDYDLGSSTDNFILFDGAYASPLWPIPVFSLANPVSWYAHVDGLLTDAIARTLDSAFYDYTEQDSVVVVANLGADLRGTTWVEDKKVSTGDHFGDPAFLIGSAYGDKLRAGTGDDYIDAAAGNDLIHVAEGANRVDGAEGTDTLRLAGDASDYEVYHMADGTLFFASDDMLTEAENIEAVEFEGFTLFGANLVNTPYSIKSNRLEDESWSMFEWGDEDVAYSAATEGSAGADDLMGRTLFGREGDDTLTATRSGLLHGGEGDDVLTGSSGADRLYGAEGDDVLIGGAGDTLTGGVGSDVFVLDGSKSGTAVIRDFNIHEQGTDLIALSSVGDFTDLSITQRGSTACVSTGTLEIRLLDCDATGLSADDFLFI